MLTSSFTLNLRFLEPLVLAESEARSSDASDNKHTQMWCENHSERPRTERVSSDVANDNDYFRHYGPRFDGRPPSCHAKKCLFEELTDRRLSKQLRPLTHCAAAVSRYPFTLRCGRRQPAARHVCQSDDDDSWAPSLISRQQQQQRFINQSQLLTKWPNV